MKEKKDHKDQIEELKEKIKLLELQIEALKANQGIHIHYGTTYIPQTIQPQPTYTQPYPPNSYPFTWM